MKKLLFTASLFVSSFGLFAQEAVSYKPAAGDKTLELQFAPLGGAPFSMGGIRFRQFMSETTALRATVYLGYTRSSEITQEADSDAKLEQLKKAESAFEIGIRPGFEKHLGGTSRLSPYYGAELDLAIRNTSEVQDVQTGETKVEKGKTRNGDGFKRFGLNAIFGADYYIAEKVFLGAEMGFGLAFTKDSKTVNVATDGKKTESKMGKGGDFAFGPNVLAQFRLGIVF